jgi:hypothetical protein
MKTLLVAMILCASFGVAAAQAQTGKASTKTATVGVRSECVANVGLCVNVPSGWQRLGDVFEGLGFVVAEPHAGTDSATWPQLTVAAIDVPARKDQSGKAVAPSLDSLVDIVLTPDGSFTSVETLQRSRLLLNGANAEIVRVRLHDDASKAANIEAVALIEGDEGLVYSIALRCASGDYDRLETIFDKTAHSWRIKPPATPEKPKEDSERK